MLPFETLASHQPEWDSRIDLEPGLRLTQVFTATEDHLSRIEVFLVPDPAPAGTEPPDTGLRFMLWEGDEAVGAPVRASRPGPPVRVSGAGWFSFEFDALGASRGRVYTLGVEGRGGVALLAHRRLGARLTVGAKPVSGSIAFRAVARRAPEHAAHFDAVRRSIETQASRLEQGPLHVRLEIAAACNLACIMCPFGLPGGYAPADGVRFLTLDMFRMVEPLLPHLLTVNAFGLGEPFLNPHFMTMLRRIRAVNDTAVVFCSTNGVTYPERTITAVVAERLVDVLQVSVDGATKETYEKVRVGGRFDVLMKNLAFLHREKQRLRAVMPSTKVQMVVMRPNMDEVAQVARSMIAHGVDVLRLDTVKDHPELEITSYDDVRRLNDQLLEAIQACTQHRVAIEGTLLKEIDPMLDAAAAREGRVHPRPGGKVIPLVPDEASRTSGVGRPECTAPWESFTLAANGDVRLCCYYWKVMGSALHSSFADVWNGPAYIETRERLCTGRYEDMCARCLAHETFMPDQEIRSVYRERRVDAAPLAAAPDPWAAARGRHVDALRAPARTPAGQATVRCAGLFDGLAETATGPIDVHGELVPAPARALAADGELRVALAVGGVVANVVPASPQGRGRWRWQARADASLFRRGAAIEVWVAGETGGVQVLQPCTMTAPILGPLGPGPLGSVVVRTASGQAVPVVASTASPLVGHLEPVVTDDATIRLSGWALDWRLTGSDTVIGVYADGRFVDEVTPWIERTDVASTLDLVPGRASLRTRGGDARQPGWLCTGFFVDLPVAVAPWLGDAHIRLIQVSRELGLATEIEYGPGYPFGPRPAPLAIGASAAAPPVVR
jgi:MoaA/NifB/PqqE/SkfB family radical SAM enzyme